MRRLGPREVLGPARAARIGEHERAQVSHGHRRIGGRAVRIRDRILRQLELLCARGAHTTGAGTLDDRADRRRLRHRVGARGRGIARSYRAIGFRTLELVPVLVCIFVGAALYTSVGHGGATVYTAILTLFGFAIAPLVTLVLVMNIVAATIAWVTFEQAGYLKWRLLLPFLVTSVPFAYFGGLLPLTGRVQAVLLGLAL